MNFRRKGKSNKLSRENIVEYNYDALLSIVRHLIPGMFAWDDVEVFVVLYFDLYCFCQHGSPDNKLSVSISS